MIFRMLKKVYSSIKCFLLIHSVFVDASLSCPGNACAGDVLPTMTDKQALLVSYPTVDVKIVRPSVHEQLAKCVGDGSKAHISCPSASSPISSLHVLCCKGPLPVELGKLSRLVDFHVVNGCPSYSFPLKRGFTRYVHVLLFVVG